MTKYLQISFYYYMGIYKKAVFISRATWLRITENKVVIHMCDNTFQEYRLRNITNFEVTTLY